MRTIQIKLCFYALIMLIFGGGISTQFVKVIPNKSQQFYKIINKVTITDLVPNRVGKNETSYIFETELEIKSVWDDGEGQLLQIHFKNPIVSTNSVREAQIKTQQITQIPDRPFYVLLVEGGRPSHVIAHTSRDQSILNLKNGIASLLQVRLEDAVPIKEIDVSGLCNVMYSVKSSTRVEKIKTDCSNWDLKVNYRTEKALGVSQHSLEHIYYDLAADGLLLKAESKEVHRMALESKPDVGSVVTSEIILSHIADGSSGSVKQLEFPTSHDAVLSLLEWNRVFDIQADVDAAFSDIKHKNLPKEISRLSEQLANKYIGRAELSEAFVQLYPLLRIATKSELVKLLNRHQKLHSQLVDLFGASQTIEAHQAIQDVFHYNREKDAELLEKYLQSLAVGSHPERDIIEDLFEKLNEKSIDDKRLLDTLIQTVASLTRQSGFDSNDPLLSSIRGNFTEKLTNSDGCKSIDCKLLYLRALQNLQDSETIPLLFQYALDNKNTQLSVAAMRALKSFPGAHFRKSHRKKFVDIFYQTRAKYDSSARILALDILLALEPTKQELNHLLDFLERNDRRQFELKTFTLQKLRLLAEECPSFRAILADCLAQRPSVYNYNIMAQKGLTTVLKRRISEMPHAVNESLLSIQEINKGVLKRGTVEFFLGAGGEETSTFKLGLYTSGLTELVGSDDQSSFDGYEKEEIEVGDDPPTTAGMEISVQGTQMRPLVFFSGQTELMGHVWSGTASEPTPAYQATTLTQRHEHYVILSSGATLFVRIIGAQSIDLNGKVEISLWNRNANTEIQKNTAIAVHGETIVGFTFAQVENNFRLIYEPKISLQANIDFYDKIELCMQLQRPEIQQTYSNTRSIALRASKSFRKTVKSKYSHKSSGFTLALNQKNNDMCNKIFSL